MDAELNCQAHVTRLPEVRKQRVPKTQLLPFQMGTALGSQTAGSWISPTELAWHPGVRNGRIFSDTEHGPALSMGSVLLWGTAWWRSQASLGAHWHQTGQVLPPPGCLALWWDGSPSKPSKNTARHRGRSWFSASLGPLKSLLWDKRSSSGTGGEAAGVHG